MILTIADAPSCAIIPLDPTNVIVIADTSLINQTILLVKVLVTIALQLKPLRWDRCINVCYRH